MKAKLLGLLLGGFCALAPAAFAQANPPATSEQKVNARRVKALNDALREFQKNNDQDSAAFVSGILTALNQPGGQTPAALATDLEHMKNKVRELVRRGAMASASTMNYGQVNAFWFDSPAQPEQPNHKTGGTPGPGGLVLYLPFDKPDDNGVVHDESGAGNDGRVFGAQWVANGKFGGAYRFSLTNFDDRIIIPNSDLLNPAYITIAAWIKPASNYGFWQRIIDKDCWHGYCFSLAGSAKIRGRPWFEGQVGIGADRALDDNQWHHIAATYDGKTVCCYVDGVKKSRRVKNPGPLQKDGWDLCIGNSVPDFGGELLSFDGLIDEVRIYNRALSAEEIKALAAGTRAGADVLPTPETPAAKADPAARLKKLQSLYEQGLITRDEFEKKKTEILNSL